MAAAAGDDFENDDGLGGSVFEGETEAGHDPNTPQPLQQRQRLSAPGAARPSQTQLECCVICLVSLRAAGQRWCKDCKRDVDHAWRCATREKWQDKYKEEQKRDETFRRLILDVRRTCPALGRGRSRQEFNILQYMKTHYSKTEVVRGSMHHMMGFSAWMKHNKDHSLQSSEDAHAEWMSWEADPDATGREWDRSGDKDKDGVRGYRFEVSVADYIDKRNVKGVASEVTQVSKPRRNFSEEHLDNAMQTLDAGHDSLQGRYFSSMVGKLDSQFMGKGQFSELGDATVTPVKMGPGSSGVSEESSAEKKRTNRFDANDCVKAYEKERAAFVASVVKKQEHARTAMEAQAVTQTEDNDDDDSVLKRFKAILATRKQIYNIAILDSEPAQQKMTLEKLQAGLNEKVAYLHTAIPEELVGHAMCLERLENLMSQKTKEGLNAAVVDFRTSANHFLKLIESTRRAAADIIQCVDQRSKRRIAEAKRKAKEESKVQSKAIVAGAPNGKMPKHAQVSGAVAVSASLASSVPRVYGLQPASHGQLLRQIPTYKFGEKFKTTGLTPFMICNCDDMTRRLESDSTLSVFANTFKRDFPETTSGKSKGRSSRPLPPRFASLQRYVVKSVAGDFSIDMPPAVAATCVAGSMFGYMPSMKFTGTEFNAYPAIRFSWEGTRLVLMAPFGRLFDFVKNMGPGGGPPKSLEEFFKVIENADEFPEEMFDFAVVTTNCCIYVPAGFTCIEQSLNQTTTVGLRLSVFVPRSCDVDDPLQRLQDFLLEAGNEQVAKLQAYSKEIQLNQQEQVPAGATCNLCLGFLSQ